MANQPFDIKSARLSRLALQQLRKLLPFLAAQETFKAQVEAKKLSDEMEEKLMPAEVPQQCPSGCWW